MATIKEMAEKKYPIKITAGLGCSYDMNELSRNGYIAGANTVLDIIEQALTPQKCLTDIGIDVSPEALIKTALQTIEELKNK